eukprot:2432868-Rhodomonas_salina.3
MQAPPRFCAGERGGCEVASPPAICRIHFAKHSADAGFATARLHLERQLERERVPKVKYRPMTRDGIYHAKILSEVAPALATFACAFPYQRRVCYKQARSLCCATYSRLRTHVGYATITHTLAMRIPGTDIGRAAARRMMPETDVVACRSQDGKKKEEEDWEKATLLRQTKRR